MKNVMMMLMMTRQSKKKLMMSVKAIHFESEIMETKCLWEFVYITQTLLCLLCIESLGVEYLKQDMKRVIH